MGIIPEIKWVEWFSIVMLFVTVGVPIFFLIYNYRRHRLDDPDCSKYEVFTTDSSIRGNPEMPMPASCRPFNSVNTAWIWVSIAIGGLWFILMLGAFLVSRVEPGLRQAAPM
jgi:hypothetical protein